MSLQIIGPPITRVPMVREPNDLRHDALTAVLSGKLTARRQARAPVAGKSTLNRLELSQVQPARYHKQRPPGEIILDLDATDDPVHGEQEGPFFHGYYDC